MTKIFLIVISFFALLIVANAGSLYICIDKDGNEIISDSPQDGMKCVLKETFRKPTPEEITERKEKEKQKAIEEDKANVKAKDTRNASELKNNCIECCNKKMPACYNYTADGRRCNAEFLNCVATCDSEGSSPSSWSDCWSKSGQ
jgi:hypothetical protein